MKLLTEEVSEHKICESLVDLFKGDILGEFLPFSPVPYLGTVFRTYYYNIVSDTCVVSELLCYENPALLVGYLLEV